MILRTHKRKRYVVVDKTVLEDTTLSWKAKGLLCYLLSKPDDWKVILNHLVTQAPDGITALRSGINELIEGKYIVRDQKRRAGKFDDTEYTVYETPQLGFPYTVEPVTVNRPLLNNDSKELNQAAVAVDSNEEEEPPQNRFTGTIPEDILTALIANHAEKWLYITMHLSDCEIVESVDFVTSGRSRNTDHIAKYIINNCMWKIENKEQFVSEEDYWEPITIEQMVEVCPHITQAGYDSLDGIGRYKMYQTYLKHST